MIDHVHDQSRVGVCLDTCHMFAAGHDISTKAGYRDVMEQFGEVVGWRFLKGTVYQVSWYLTEIAAEQARLLQNECATTLKVWQTEVLLHLDESGALCSPASSTLAECSEMGLLTDGSCSSRNACQ